MSAHPAERDCFRPPFQRAQQSSSVSVESWSGQITSMRLFQMTRLCAHGTIHCYWRGCHCTRCCNANAQYVKMRRVAVRQGARNKIVRADRTRDHLNALRRSGIRLQAIANITGIHYDTIRKIAKGKNPGLREQLQLYAPALAWTDREVQSWIGAPHTINLGKAKERLIAIVKQRYDDRARVLKEEHPLGIQVQLETGVANGVLIVRTIQDCAELIRRVVTGSLEYRIEKYSTESSAPSAYYLRETVSDSIYRVMSGDLMLANAFWNFYLKGIDDDAKNTAAIHA